MYKVNVIMSTYNGEKYLCNQIQSILAQKHVEIHITIRDDGSTDKTIEYLNKWKNRYPDKIEYFCSKNIGYRRSFMNCLKKAKDGYDYYAFADQDDVWNEEKCIEGIRKINEVGGKYVVYACSLIVTDEKLHQLYKNDITSSPNTLPSFFSRMRLPGCCMLFTPEIRNVALLFADMSLPNEYMLDHDFIIGTIGYSCGKVIRDDNALILHRRQNTSLTGGGKGLFKRIKGEYGLIFKRKNIKYTIAKKLIDFAQRGLVEINDEEMQFLTMVLNYKKNLKNKINLLSYKEFTSGILFGDIEVRIKILINNY